MLIYSDVKERSPPGLLSDFPKTGGAFVAFQLAPVNNGENLRVRGGLRFGFGDHLRARGDGCGLRKLDRGRFFGFVWLGGYRGSGEAFAVELKIKKGGAEFAGERSLVAAEEFEALDMVAVGRDAGVLFSFFGALADGAGEGGPGLEEVEIVVFGAAGVFGADFLFLDGDLGIEQGWFEGSEAGATPTEAGELVDEGFLHVILGEERGADAGEVALQVVFVFDGDEDVD